VQTEAFAGVTDASSLTLIGLLGRKVRIRNGQPWAAAGDVACSTQRRHRPYDDGRCG
jgi:hypothetical protein